MLRIRARTLIMFALAILGVVALGAPGSTLAATLTVDIYGVNGDDGGGNPNPVCTGSNFCAYNPDTVNIGTGDSLNFDNVGALNHTATGSLDNFQPLSTVQQPGGGSQSCSGAPNCFSTSSLTPGQTKVIGPFNTAGSENFYCEIHGPDLMQGVLNVTGGATTTTTTTTAATTTTTAATTTTTAATTTTTGATTTTTAPTTTTTGATTTTTAPTTTTTGATTTTTGATTTTTTAPTTTTTAATTTTTAATTTTTAATTTTTTAGGGVHDFACRLAPSQPAFVIGQTVNVAVIVTNTGTSTDNAHVTLDGTINYHSAQNVTLAPSGSTTLLFAYTVPVRLSVTLTAACSIVGASDPTPSDNSDTQTFNTAVL